jgi:hypothetical protein
VGYIGSSSFYLLCPSLTQYTSHPLRSVPYLPIHHEAVPSSNISQFIVRLAKRKCTGTCLWDLYEQLASAHNTCSTAMVTWSHGLCPSYTTGISIAGKRLLAAGTQ